ncbi:MAG TPA: hydroxymethylglutaryl-CoA reductase, degradative [Candidatus Diapherotrites archaeon]|uniref:3-hydroxy-3-methylglutaryl coenzyme A reductase n=1 Tax=Candidatus Iainarchaeum sp. TaxID=3101447 RepID=A0A7J4JWA0_9ARCH|nr:hydroxymethylglutaryl-CoA reductase, degradative [Candidatus Diapherotrites archaeon]
MPEKSSNLQEFYKKTLEERLAVLKDFAQLSDQELQQLKQYSALDFDTANRMIENVFSTLALPLGIATNFIVNGKEVLVPMAIEEPSVIAAASNAAKLSRSSGGFKAKASEPLMIGQIMLVGIKQPRKATEKILMEKEKLIFLANSKDQVLVKLTGGAKNLEVGFLKNKMVIVHLLVNCGDAMGANAVNTMLEGIAPEIEKLTGGTARARIISNLAIHRTVKAEAVWSKKELEESTKGEVKGEDVVQAMLEMSDFAALDPFRAATHNKGIMNGIDAVVVATGNDWRAIESGAHSFAAYGKPQYSSLTKYSKTSQGDLKGEIELPMAVGLVGGATKTHPIAKISLKILDIQNAKQLAEIIASVGLAQNFAAMRAIATEGIQKGHMKLHARNVAVNAGASGELIEKIAEQLVAEKQVNAQRALELLKEYQKS